MAHANVGVHVEHRTDEVAESQDIVALRSIHANLACTVGITILVLMKRQFSRSSRAFSIAQEAQSALEQVRLLNDSMNSSRNSKKCRYESAHLLSGKTKAR
jgi:hypothetical protein